MFPSLLWVSQFLELILEVLGLLLIVLGLLLCELDLVLEFADLLWEARLDVLKLVSYLGELLVQLSLLILFNCELVAQFLHLDFKL